MASLCPVCHGARISLLQTANLTCLVVLPIWDCDLFNNTRTPCPPSLIIMIVFDSPPGQGYLRTPYEEAIGTPFSGWAFAVAHRVTTHSMSAFPGSLGHVPCYVLYKCLQGPVLARTATYSCASPGLSRLPSMARMSVANTMHPPIISSIRSTRAEYGVLCTTIWGLTPIVARPLTYDSRVRSTAYYVPVCYQ